MPGTWANISRPLGRKFSYELKFTWLSVRVLRDIVVTGMTGRCVFCIFEGILQGSTFTFYKVRKFNETKLMYNSNTVNLSRNI